MFCSISVVLALVYAAPIVTIDHDVIEFQSREGRIPFRLDAKSQDGLDALRLFVSDDQGRTWKLVEEIKPAEQWFKFKVAKDGNYWFAGQTVQRDGQKNPSESRFLVPSLKIYVNQERKTLVRREAPQLNPQEKK